MVKHDYKLNRRGSIQRLQTSIKALSSFFAQQRAQDITLDRLNAYTAHRMEAGMAPSTIRYDLAILKRGFRLAKKGNKAIPPEFPSIEVCNTRSRFFEEEQFIAVRRDYPKSNSRWQLLRI